jgi:hypothetical protein
MLLAYIYRSITHRVHFLDKASTDLFICAKDLFVAASHTARPKNDGGRCDGRHGTAAEQLVWLRM